jgi:hypothetical protein
LAVSGKSAGSKDCVVDLRGLELRARHPVRDKLPKWPLKLPPVDTNGFALYAPIRNWFGALIPTLLRDTCYLLDHGY